MAACLALAAFAPGTSHAAPKPAYVVVDAADGRVLSHSRAGKLWYPASLTKIMTAYVTFRAIKEGSVTLQSPVKVSKYALSQAPSKMGFKVGTQMTIDNAIKMMIVKSANDIAVALAEAVSGSEAKFVARMNAEAARLGMVSTRFNNPNGLPDAKKQTTARDMAVLALAVWREFPQYREYFRIPAIRVGKRILRSYNTLLTRYRGSNGMKTGYICSSGFNLVGSATRNGKTVFVVVLGAFSSQARAELAATLLDHGFRGGLGTNKIDRFYANKVIGSPVDLRPQICSAEARAERAESAKKKPVRSALVPKFETMKPVRVYTGRVKGPPASVPLPRLRPNRGDNSGKSAALADEPATVQ